ncbi:MAG: DUF1102 domain-containing protein [Archaeoglobaceae archaeon]|nr:DUF1102 domain-containing protein [Archaeoglobales archaeon]MDI9643000.1 DUF1102 domain-containing protein [Archaeoglobales archaeon]
MTKIFLLLISAVVAVSLLGLGADFRSYDANRSFTVAVVADDQELIDLTPIQPYAYINTDGKIYFDFSKFNPNYPGGGKGVSPNTTYAFDQVFKVSNDLWPNDSGYDGICVEVSASGNIAGILKLYSPDDVYGHTTPSTAANSVSMFVEGGDFAVVGFVINTNGYPAGNMINGQITVVAHTGSCPV